VALYGNGFNRLIINYLDMNKAALRAVVESKVGFHSIIRDELAPDHIPGDTIEKRFFHINNVNANGTMGKTYVYYLHNTANDEASFYNAEPESVDTQELTAEEKKFRAIDVYLNTTFAAFFVTRRSSFLNKVWVEADVYVDGASLTKNTVIVTKVGTANPTHKVVL